MQPFDAVHALENARPIDRVVDPVRTVVQRLDEAAATALVASGLASVARSTT